MMRRVHPLWRGFWLALALTAALLLSDVDALMAYRLNRRMLALCGATALGAFLAALPGRLRRLRERPEKPRWTRCVTALVCGVAMSVGLGLSGSGRILLSLAEGSTGAMAFVLAAWGTGLITLLIAGRRLR